MNTGSRRRESDEHGLAHESSYDHGFVRSHFGLNIPASPPDVRQGYALPEAVRPVAPKSTGGKPRTRGRAQISRLELTGGAQPRLTSGGGAEAKDVHGSFIPGRTGTRRRESDGHRLAQERVG